MHLLAIYPPKVRLSELANSLKGVSSRRLKVEFPTISSFWSIRKSGSQHALHGRLAMITGIVWCGRTLQRSAANKRAWFRARHQALTESDCVARKYPVLKLWVPAK